MAKRKRLSLPIESEMPELETKSALAASRSRMPIAEVAGDTARSAALEEVAIAMTQAEEEGRVVKRLPLDRIDMHHLNRDRMVVEEEAFESLKSSIAERGQQSPIEVLRLSSGRFGLISGLRRIEAIKGLGQDTVLALVRDPETAQAAYIAMIEENEIRADVSFYERANIAAKAVGAGVYDDVRSAVKGLFARSPAAKRSKILKFVTLREKLGRHLRFPTAIPERLGIALAGAIEADIAVARRINDTLRKTPPVDASAERRVLERGLRDLAAPRANKNGEDIAPGLHMEVRKGRVVLSGTGLDAAFQEDLRAWINERFSHAKSGSSEV